MGILQKTMDGFNIEQYVPQSFVRQCHNQDLIEKSQTTLFKEDKYWPLLVEPYLDHTVKGVLWYQGELYL